MCMVPLPQTAAAGGAAGRDVVDVVGGDRVAARRRVDPGGGRDQRDGDDDRADRCRCDATQPATAPTAAAAGRVSSQASAICPATPQRTAASRRPAPAPRIAPVATWVVDSAKPRCDDARMTVAALVSAAKPCGVWISLTRLPRVRMIRQPPT